MFSLKWTIIILLILLIPFCLRTFTGIEPYPAVLLPSGAATIKKAGDYVTLNSKEIYGLDSNGNWKKIQMPLFLYPIPMRYLPPLLSINFGLDINSKTNKSKRTNILKKLHLLDDNVISRNDKRKKVEIWLKEKLVRQRLSSTKIKITTFKQIISTKTGTPLKNIIKNERIIILDE